MTVTQEALVDLETEMQMVVEAEYAGALSKAWWQLVAKQRDSRQKKAVLSWLLSTAFLNQNDGGSVRFDELAEGLSEIEIKTASSGLRLTMQEFEDAVMGPDSEAIDRAISWAAQMAAAFAYWPQKLAGQFLRSGHLSTPDGGFVGYDGVPFFSENHPLDPFDESLGSFSNLLSGPNAKPIDASVSVDVALQNLADVFAHVGRIRMPNDSGDFRNLRPKAILAPPKLYPRAKELCAKMASPVPANLVTGSFFEYVEAMSGLGNVCAAQVGELSGFEDETSYFVAVDQAGPSQLGAFVYLVREEFNIRYHQPDATLTRRGDLEWVSYGRNKMAAGHPYLLFKVTAT